MPIYRESSTVEIETAIMRETYDCTHFVWSPMAVSVRFIWFSICWSNCVFHSSCDCVCLFPFSAQFTSVQFISVQLNSFGLPDVCLPLSIALCTLCMVRACICICVCVYRMAYRSARLFAFIVCIGRNFVINLLVCIHYDGLKLHKHPD